MYSAVLEPVTIQPVTRHCIENTTTLPEINLTEKFDDSIAVEAPCFDAETVDKAH
jgi:hypothetical protein